MNTLEKLIHPDYFSDFLSDPLYGTGASFAQSIPDEDLFFPLDDSFDLGLLQQHASTSHLDAPPRECRSDSSVQGMGNATPSPRECFPARGLIESKPAGLTTFGFSMMSPQSMQTQSYAAVARNQASAPAPVITARSEVASTWQTHASRAPSRQAAPITVPTAASTSLSTTTTYPTVLVPVGPSRVQSGLLSQKLRYPQSARQLQQHGQRRRAASNQNMSQRGNGWSQSVSGRVQVPWIPSAAPPRTFAEVEAATAQDNAYRSAETQYQEGSESRLVPQRQSQYPGFACDRMLPPTSISGSASDCTGSYPSYGLSSPLLSNAPFSSFGTTPDESSFLGVLRLESETYSPDVAGWSEESYNLGDHFITPDQLSDMSGPGLPYRSTGPSVPISIDGSASSYTCNDLVCKSPNKVFPKKADLEHHQRWHGPRPNVCNQCDRAFVSSKDLQRHGSEKHDPNGRVHFGPFTSCLLCVRGFARLDHLRRHLRTHGMVIPSTSSSRAMSRTPSVRLRR